MKKVFSLFLSILMLASITAGVDLSALAASEVEISETNFPDDTFRSYVSEEFDSDNNGTLSSTEIAKATNISVEYKGISSLAGIKNFTALQELYCSSNQLTSLDVSNLAKLKWLYCGDNRLTSLDVGGCTALTYLECFDNQLTSLDVSNNTALESLSCYRNQITSLDISKNTALDNLGCDDNQLTSLDVSKNTALDSLCCGENQLTSLDVSKNTALTYLGCDDNQLTSLDVSKNTALQVLSFEENQLTDLDVSNLAELEWLYCDDNQLTSLDVSSNTALQGLDCRANQITSLDVSKNTALQELICYDNQLTSLDVSNLAELKWLYCHENQLTSLNVSNLTNLEWLFCGYNQLTSLDVSGCTALTYLECYDNQLTSLDVSNNTALESLICDNNKLTNLEVSKNTELQVLYCGSNQLTSLDVSSTALDEDGLFCWGNIYNIGSIENGSYDLENLPGSFDVSKASGWDGADCSEAGVLTDFDGYDITYTYDLGKGLSETFTLTFDGSRSGNDYDDDDDDYDDDWTIVYTGESFAVNETKKVDVINCGDINVYAFTPEESNLYTFYSTGGYDTYASIYDADGNYLNSNDDGAEDCNFAVTAYMTAGETYYLCCRMLNSGETGTFDVTLVSGMYAWDEDDEESKKWRTVFSETALALGDTVTINAEAGCQYFYSFTPEESGVYVFSFTDAENAQGYIYNSSFGCIMMNESEEGDSFSLNYILAAGETYYIACRMYSADIAGSAALTVGKYTEVNGGALSLGEEVTVNAEAGHLYYYTFTPDEDMEYVLSSTGDGGWECRLCYEHITNPWGEIYGDEAGSYLLTEYLCAGETYIIACYMLDEDASGSFTLKVDEGCRHEYEISGVVAPTCESDGYTVYTCTQCGRYYYDDWKERMGHSFENGKCKNCGQVSTALMLGTTTTTVNGAAVYYSFTPTESGTYTFSSSTDACDPFVDLYDADWNWLDYSDDEGDGFNFSLSCNLTAGKTYIYKCELYDSNAGSFDVTLETVGFTHTTHRPDSGVVTQAATCTATGVKEYTCEVCGTKETESIAKIPHTYVTTTTKATTSKNGSVVKKCTACGYTASSTTIYYAKTLSLSATSYTYNGKAKKPTVTVKDSKGNKISSSYYTVSYINRSTGKTVSSMKSVGKYYVKVKFKGKYSGSLKKAVTIKPKAASIKSVTAAKKAFTVKWGKVTTQTTGYQIQYSTSKSFKNAKTKTVKSNKTTSKKITGLKAKKKYYVRVRTYKTVKINGKSTKIYSSWSKAKTVTTKK